MPFSDSAPSSDPLGSPPPTAERIEHETSSSNPGRTDGSWPSGGNTASADGTRSRRSRARQLAPWIAGTVSLLLLLTTLLIGWRVRESMRQINRTSIETIRNANVAVMSLWLDGRSADVATCAKDENLQRLATKLLEDARNGPESSDDNDAGQQADELHAAVRFDRNEFLGWCLIDDDSKVVASDHASLVGVRFPIADDVRDQLDLGNNTVTRPFHSSVAIKETGPLSKAGCPLMMAISPIRRGVTSLGGLALMIDPLGHFCQLLQTAQIGKSCETIAMDAQGVLLTSSRFGPELRLQGILDAESSGALQLHARAPKQGGPVANSDLSQVVHLPLTLAADQATRGATGSNLTGYNDYRGVRVIGTWCWVPRYNMSVVTKIDYDEAYGPMQILRKSFAGLLGVVLLASFGLFAMAAIVRRFSADHSPSRRLGQYELKETLDIGGAGKVYLARHESLQRDVAVKVLEYDAVNPHSFSRFEREVRLTAKLQHPNTVEIYDYGCTADGTFFYVMQYVEGISLATLIHRHGRQSPARVIHILKQVCGSLAEAHVRGMVHRDIKPANILLSSQVGVFDLVKVLDFGLVKDLQQDSVQLTQIASITGTPSYMSPESVRDASASDQRSDIYSLGAVGYHLLCGSPVFTGENAADICAKQLHETPIPLQQRISELRDREPTSAEISSDLTDLLMACLQKDPHLRPPTMVDLADALAHCAQANEWTSADAGNWWRTAASLVPESPRDAAGDFADNATTSKPLLQ